MAKRGAEEGFDRELTALPPGPRWREWMRRVEAVLFASAKPVRRGDLARVVGEAASVDLLIADLREDLAERPYEIVAVADAFLIRTRPAYAPAIRTAADLGSERLALNAFETAVLAAIAWNQPITRAGLAEIFGREISRDLIGRLRDRDFIAAGPRSPRPGAPHTFVTTEGFLAAFDLESLRDLPDAEMAEEDGLIERRA
ncbi:SMC-Scp complex subunit ScpB [Amaricoccus solimangrovi]|uniref:SMC-Scp complex subunit ScpB n=1 Tax=Amaricoccus solimangrovi TaxID=2589815 RepID=A0A501WEI4_9RHOB|nr:SMC-Scp complex subunit ScpB [Amaricoccus solimangrovi]TPE46905.1 SMC-Scp complex subunit ScpB [Amaricoccus solimangrovi]